MNDAQLNSGFWKDTVNRFRKTCKIVYGGNKGILCAAIIQIRQYRQPELGVLAFRQIQPQDFLVASQRIQRKKPVADFTILGADPSLRFDA